MILLSINIGESVKFYNLRIITTNKVANVVKFSNIIHTKTNNLIKLFENYLKLPNFIYYIILLVKF